MRAGVCILVIVDIILYHSLSLMSLCFVENMIIMIMQGILKQNRILNIRPYSVCSKEFLTICITVHALSVCPFFCWNGV